MLRIDRERRNRQPEPRRAADAAATQLGCSIALDDFGTGLGSLAYLRTLPIDFLKIDGSFVRDVLKDSRAESMVQAIAQLARSMSLTTVAEYVETEEILTRITSLGVDYGQGFAIGRPVPLADVVAELPLYAAAAHPSGVWPARTPHEPPACGGTGPRLRPRGHFWVRGAGL